jgi:hypothetical protein
MTLADGILTLAFAAAAADAALVQRALEATTSARVQVIDTRLGLPEGCAARAVRADGPVTHSGVVALDVEGVGPGGTCHGRGWARMRLFAPVWVVTQTVREGEDLRSAAVRVERELLAGLQPVDALPEGARARVTLPRGAVVETRHLRGAGPAPGERVVVEVLVGSVRLEQEAVAIACPGACARLSNGARVEGTFVDGKLRVTP